MNDTYCIFFLIIRNIKIIKSVFIGFIVRNFYQSEVFRIFIGKLQSIPFEEPVMLIIFDTKFRYCPFIS